MSTRFASVLAAATAAAALALLTADVVEGGPTSRFDAAVHGWLPVLHGPWWAAAYLLVLPGQRWLQAPVALVVAGLLSWRHRSWRPLVRVAAGLALLAAGGGLLKVAVGRAAPGTGMASVHTGGMSFPSGHVAGVVVLGGIVVNLLTGPRRRQARRVWLVAVVAVACGVVLTGFHWLSDVLGGLALGVLLLLLATAQPGRVQLLRSHVRSGGG